MSNPKVRKIIESVERKQTSTINQERKNDSTGGSGEYAEFMQLQTMQQNQQPITYTNVVGRNMIANGKFVAANKFTIDNQQPPLTLTKA